jgi:hypothetical protein
VHGTIIGLEGTEATDGVRNENFLRWRHEERRIDFAGLLALLRSQFAGFTARIGGFSAAVDYGFLSQGQHPFLRSFSLQRDIAVAIGWPIQDGAISPALDQLRRDLQRFGVLHKWHRQPDDVDNDFFFVLGRVNEALRNERRSAVEQELREQLARRKPLDIVVAPAALSFVGYHDPQLPLTSSPSARLTDPGLTAERLREIYATEA